MARACQVDDSLERQFETLLKQQAGPEVGVLVGKQAPGGKALLYGTIKTPAPEGLEPLVVTGAGSAAPAGGSSKAGKKPGPGGRAAAGTATTGGVSVSLEADWITEHVRQVARMLPGGLAVLGLYIFCPEAAYSVAAPQLCTLLAGLAAVCLPPKPAAGADPSAAAAGDQLLLLHIDATSRKQSLRALPVAAAAASVSSLKPVELKYGPALAGLVLLRCWHGVDLALPVPAGVAGGGGAEGGTGAPMRRHLAALVASESERIRSGLFVTAAGALPPDSSQVGEALAAGSSTSTSTSGGETAGPSGDISSAVHVPVFDLTLLAPPRCRQLPSEAAPQSQPQPSQAQQPQPAGVSSQAVVGQARLRGCLQGLAFVSKREAVGRAVADLKADLLASLTSRLEVLVEEATRGSDQQATAEQQQQPTPLHPLLNTPAQLAAGAGEAFAGSCDLALPRRVLLPWLGGGLALCDYLLEGEPVEAAAERAQQLLALRGSRVVELETPPPVASGAAATPWRPNALPGEVPADGGQGGSSASRAASSGLPCGNTVIASLAVAAVASAVGVFSLLGQQAGQQ